MADLPNDLRTALEQRLAEHPAAALRAAVTTLMTAYRSGGTPASPILNRSVEVAAYAAYRMPATYAAVRSVFGALPMLAPASLVDVGGGTGAAAWAAIAAYPSITAITVLDRVDGALRFGADLARSATSTALRNATWQRAMLPAGFPPADLVTMSYLLGELDGADRQALVDRAAAAGGAVVIVEPGTPAGYARILAARDRLLALGHVVVAPCPHQVACPLGGPLGAGDWCHFGARVNRTALHRRVKGADLPYEDEKFAYVATAPAPAATIDANPEARVIRRPAQRKGLVALRLCRPDGTAADRTVTKRDAELYRRARDTSWGDAFPADPANGR
ncbi:MAG TPA: small ribosomal subunit Rsm22 family protein [Micromonosporaceae bacterium]|jgi:ribosomal protein RSM22 (predicted rRNA methylase)|nr:small ribosomal subunit Rsm22 family protein [Micromonosporaceae bacterium]